MKAPILTFQDVIKFLGPKWLVRDKIRLEDGTVIETDSRLFTTIARYFNAYRDRVATGIASRFPGGGAPEDALPYIGRDHGIFRGPTEAQAAFELRLQRAKDDARKLGIAWSMLQQTRAYCSPHAVRVRVVNEHANYYQIDRDGTESRGKGLDWDWSAAAATEWSRFWLLIWMTDETPKKPWDRLPNIGDPLLWENAIGTQGYTIGSTATPGDVAAIRSIVRACKPEASRCIKIIIIFRDDAPAFELDATAPPAPDGLWGHASKNVGGVQVYSRSTDAIYWGAQ